MRDLASEIRELSARFDENPLDPDALGCIETQLMEIETQLQEKQKEIGAQGEIIKVLKDALEKRESLGDEQRAAQQELERWQTLQSTIPRNDLRDFALEIMFKQMGSIANVQLSYLTSERYQLKVEGIGDLTVIDRWNANEERPVETLSGGESFLTSLALALALADLSRGRAQLNSLFLDEGFGTLDTETLDIAIAALEGLRMQGRSIFLISHIQELTRRLPVKINVKKQGNGSSSIDI
jgi:exonuclease SbcC